jgi:WhiB family transcriptional regulator, redox-sensing transcriptional regulator
MSSRPDWRLRAACLDADPELFFPEGTSGPALEEAARAKVVCAGCLVQARCLDWALANGVAFGIWGGRTEQERRVQRIESALQH